MPFVVFVWDKGCESGVCNVGQCEVAGTITGKPQVVGLGPTLMGDD